MKTLLLIILISILISIQAQAQAPIQHKDTTKYKVDHRYPFIQGNESTGYYMYIPVDFDGVHGYDIMILDTPLYYYYHDVPIFRIKEQYNLK